ncbi:MAG: triacylglycerol lipase [Alphaproteobacteria bacterium]|nr:triacylglycerol lipase [Alphaproteobacteria bacterium]
MQHVFLVPGFFGFSSIGGMRYFTHVHAFLAASLRARGVDAQLHEVATLPTATLQRRAGRLAEAILARTGPDDAVHVVGHSTGGLDARILTGPAGASLADGRWAARRGQVQSVIGVASPHAGAPVADFFSTLQGERVLHLLSLFTLHVVRLGSFATEPANLLLAAASKAGSLDGVEAGLLDDVRKGVLADFDAGRRDELQAFFREVRADRSLLLQLRPAGIRALRDSLVEDPRVAYASVVLMAARPRPNPAGLLDVSHRLYRRLHRLAGWPDERPPPATDPRPLSPRLGRTPEPCDSDGIVPTLAQVHGRLLHVDRGDHLDVLGYFDGPGSRPPHVDWLRSGSAYGRPAFEATWSAVAAFIAGQVGC